MFQRYKETTKLFIDKKYSFKVVILILFLILTAFFDLLSLGLLIPISYRVFDIENFTIDSSLEFLDKLIFFENINYVLLQLAIIFIIKNILIYYFNKYRIDLIAEFYKNISFKIFRSYLEGNYIQTVKTNVFTATQNIIEEAKFISERFLNSIVVFISELLILLIVIIFLLATNSLNYYLIFFLVLIWIGYYFFIHKTMIKIGEKRRILNYNLKRVASEGLQGFKDIFVLNKKKFFIDKFFKINSEYIHYSNMIGYFQNIPKIVLETILVIFFLGAILIQKNYDLFNFSFSSLILFLVLSYRLIPLIGRILISINQIKFSTPVIDHFIVSFKKIIKQINLKDKKVKNIYSNKLIKNDNKFKHEIKLEKISFNYSKKKSIFSNLNLKIKKGKMIGIFGKSGQGKTTLVNLITGILKPTKGKIFFDKIKIDELEGFYQKNFFYISEDLFIFQDSIFKNISFGEPKNKKNLRKAIDALKKVELYDYVKKLDKGLDHILLSNGKELSGGQKQKLIIARAIYFKKEIFIFDEATNSLDKKTENNIINLLKSMTPERTIILISHDLEVINKTDFIIKLNKRSANFKK